ncbi:MAG: isoleucine--tRNA ligase [Myxococcales bacterium]|nr:isoleucine--tRNA ligase [Myxococcales bacterium]
MPVFPKVDTSLRFPESEKAIIEFWRSERIFERTLERPAPNGPFVFFEGPPTANGTPHNGHVLTRVMKDLFPRYKTMRGYRVDRKAGWDTHGLPVEVEVEKELRIHGKAAIEEYGVEPFIRRCVDSVFRYTEEWRRLTERIAFWCDLDAAYVTYHKSYVESVWWALGQLLQKGLLYRGHKVVWWWAQGGTALSSGEVGQGYKQVDDPSCFVRFPLVDAPPGAPAGLALAAWTTTPWTLPSNMYAAVKAEAAYVAVQTPSGPVLVAEALADEFAKKTKGERVAGFSVKGSALAGLRYQPPFDLYAEDHAGDRTAKGEVKYWRVLVEDFVTLDSGTGIVHIAPAFGEDDNQAHKRLERTFGEPLELFCAIEADGTFKADVPKWAGQWVKDADKGILDDLHQRGLLLLKELYRHDYPFCWRADDDPLIQFARPAWFIRTTAHKDDAIANNREVNWLPPHIKEGRFGDFLQNNVDWALSRERFWGTPLNVWVSEDDPTDMHAPTSVDEILKLNPHAFDHFHAAKKADPTLSDDLIVHKPWIDQVTFPSPKTGKTMRRVPEVIDCWFDSGCMPFAQWGFPHQQGSVERMRSQWPADFISEAIDQTRGWFYSLLMISTLVFDAKTRAEFGLDPTSKAHPYKTCIVLGHVGDREGKKESKSKGNYTPPEVILDRVRMEFAVVDAAQSGVEVKPGECAVARDDLDGLDLQDGAKVDVYVGEGAARSFVVRAHKKLPRRVVVLGDADRAAVGAELYPRGLDVKPVEVPRLPEKQRVYLEDPSTPAPGADAFRWFFYAASPPWTNTRHSLSNVRALQKDFAIKLRNVLSFFTIYANIDGFDPRVHRRAEVPASPLDRWLLSELALAVRDVTTHMDRYEVYESAQTLVALTESLSNWWLRRSRDRFWAAGTAEASADKRDAYGTLHEALVTIAKVAAPFTPFLAEEAYRALVHEPGAPPSVHLCDFPTADVARIDEPLSREMADARAVVSLGLQVRTASKLKVRRPLATATVVMAKERAAGLRAHLDVIKEELNVHVVELVAPDHAGDFVTFKLKPNFRSLGPRIGKEVQAVKKALETVDAGSLRAELVTNGKAIVPGVLIDGQPLEVTQEDVEVQVIAREGFAAAGDRVGVVVLDTRITPELEAEGIARELQNRLQTLRKELGLEFQDRVDVRVTGPAATMAALRTHTATIAEAVLCASGLVLVDGEDADPAAKEVEVEGAILKVRLTKA